MFYSTSQGLKYLKSSLFKGGKGSLFTGLILKVGESGVLAL